MRAEQHRSSGGTSATRPLVVIYNQTCRIGEVQWSVGTSAYEDSSQ